MLTIYYGSLKGKARYQRGHSAQYSGFKLATSTFVLSVLDSDVYQTLLKTSANKFFGFVKLSIFFWHFETVKKICHLGTKPRPEKNWL